MIRTAILLVAAHVIGDFLLQPDWMVRQKKSFPCLCLHAVIHAILVYLFLQNWTAWLLPLAVLIAHPTIDFLKNTISEDNAKGFAYDQGMHVTALLLIVWIFQVHGSLLAFDGSAYELIVLVAGFIATVRGAGFLLAKLTTEIKEKNELELDGLENGGAWIGSLERCLIFIFVIIGHPAGIGFLVAAKSILRFEEAKKQKLAEYVLIGTLLSFSLGTAFAAATKWALGQ